MKVLYNHGISEDKAWLVANIRANKKSVILDILRFKESSSKADSGYSVKQKENFLDSFKH